MFQILLLLKVNFWVDLLSGTLKSCNSWIQHNVVCFMTSFHIMHTDTNFSCFLYIECELQIWKKVHLGSSVERCKPQVDFSSIADSNRFVNWLCCDRSLRDPHCSQGMGHLGRGHCQCLFQSEWLLSELWDGNLQNMGQIQAGMWYWDGILCSCSY